MQTTDLDSVTALNEVRKCHNFHAFPPNNANPWCILPPTKTQNPSLGYKVIFWIMANFQIRCWCLGMCFVFHGAESMPDFKAPKRTFLILIQYNRLFFPLFTDWRWKKLLGTWTMIMNRFILHWCFSALHGYLDLFLVFKITGAGD